VMCKHNKSEFQRGLIYLLRLVFPQNNYVVFPGVLGFCLLTPNSVKDIHPYHAWCGDVTDDGVGGIMEPGRLSENN